MMVFLTKAKKIVKIIPSIIQQEAINRFFWKSEENCFLIPTKKLKAANKHTFIIVNKRANFLILKSEMAAIETMALKTAKKEHAAKATNLSVHESPQHFSVSSSLERPIRPVTIDI